MLGRRQFTSPWWDGSSRELVMLVKAAPILSPTVVGHGVPIAAQMFL